MEQRPDRGLRIRQNRKLVHRRIKEAAMTEGRFQQAEAAARAGFCFCRKKSRLQKSQHRRPSNRHRRQLDRHQDRAASRNRKQLLKLTHGMSKWASNKWVRVAITGSL